MEDCTSTSVPEQGEKELVYAFDRLVADPDCSCHRHRYGCAQSPHSELVGRAVFGGRRRNVGLDAWLARRRAKCSGHRPGNLGPGILLLDGWYGHGRHETVRRDRSVDRTRAVDGGTCGGGDGGRNHGAVLGGWRWICW